MLLLNIITDLATNWWPWALFIFLTIGSLFGISLLLFTYIDGLEVQYRKMVAEINNTLFFMPQENWWQRYCIWIKNIRKKKKSVDEDDLEEYNDRAGSFQTVGVIILFVLLIWGISSIDFGSWNTPEWIISTITSIWFWIVLVVIIITILLTAFRKKMDKNWVTWKNFKRLLLGIIFVVLTYVTVSWLLKPKKGIDFSFSGSDSPNAGSVGIKNKPTQSTTSSSQQYSKLNISGSNDMKKGIWKKFSIRRDGDPLWFTPAIAQGDTLTYYFKKVEDETRSWAVQAWIDSNGEPVEKHITSDEPYPEAQLGECLVSTDKDVVVVVEVKKKK